MTEEAFFAIHWHRHGDDPRVKVATVTDIPTSPDPSRFGVLLTDDGRTRRLVIPGDWIVTRPDGSTVIMSERDFRRRYDLQPGSKAKHPKLPRVPCQIVAFPKKAPA